MSPFDQRQSEREDARLTGRIDCAGPSGPTTCNVLTGTVVSRTKGLTRTTLRIRVGEQTHLRVRWLASAPAYDAVDIGHTVRLVIPEEAVQLEAGGFRRGKQRWNRWIGRVVLVDRNNDDPVTTVKIHRDIITLKSRGPVIGAQVMLKTWDTVNIIIDPQQIRLASLKLSSSTVDDAVSDFPTVPQPASVWLRAIIRSLRSNLTGHEVALTVGGVNLSALVEADREALREWTVGTLVEINISHFEAWVRLDAKSPLFRCGVVFSTEAEVPRKSDFVR